MTHHNYYYSRRTIKKIPYLLFFVSATWSVAHAQSMTDLSILSGTYSSASAISAEGSVIVGEADTAGGQTHAFAYANPAGGGQGAMIDIL